MYKLKKKKNHRHLIFLKCLRRLDLVKAREAPLSMLRDARFCLRPTNHPSFENFYRTARSLVSYGYCNRKLKLGGILQSALMQTSQPASILQVRLTSQESQSVFRSRSRSPIERKMPSSTSTTVSNPVLRFAKLSENATTPTRGSTFAAGYDLYR